MDDIKDVPQSSETEKPGDGAQPRIPPPRAIGPESEVRGGPEAPSDDEATNAPSGAR
jgi:hypothetical protein